jgi:hypothetical protein
VSGWRLDVARRECALHRNLQRGRQATDGASRTFRRRNPLGAIDDGCAAKDRLNRRNALLPKLVLPFEAHLGEAVSVGKQIFLRPTDDSAGEIRPVLFEDSKATMGPSAIENLVGAWSRKELVL